MCKEAGGGGEGARDTESKTRTPHKVVGNKEIIMKPPALHGFCSFSSLGMRMAKQILRRKISNA